MAAEVYRDDELVTFYDLLAGLAPPLQPHFRGPLPHIVVGILLVIATRLHET